MARLSPRSNADTNRPSTATDGAGSDSTPWRSLLLVLGIAALAYVALRWYREGAERAMDRLPEPIADEAETVLEEAQSIEIDAPGEDAAEARRSAADDGEPEAGDRTDDGDRDEKASLDAVSTTDRSPEEITERAEPNVQAEPSEPGTMTVDEAIADEVIDGLETDAPRDDDARDDDVEDTDGTADEERNEGAESREKRDD